MNALATKRLKTARTIAIVMCCTSILGGCMGLINLLFGCHHTFGFPIVRKVDGKRTPCYVKCTQCGAAFEYDWNEMRVDMRKRVVV